MTEQGRSFRAYRYTIFRQGSTTGMLDESGVGATVMTYFAERTGFSASLPHIYPTRKSTISVSGRQQRGAVRGECGENEAMKPLLMVETICRWMGSSDATKTADLVYGDAAETIQVLYQAVTKIVRIQRRRQWRHQFACIDHRFHGRRRLGHEARSAAGLLGRDRTRSASSDCLRGRKGQRPGLVNGLVVVEQQLCREREEPL